MRNLLGAFLLALALAGGWAQAQTPPATTPAPAPASAPAATATAVAPEAAARLRAILADEAQRAELLRALDALAAPQPATAAPTEAPILQPDTLGAEIITGAEQQARALSAQILATLRTLTDLPGLLNWLSGLARDPVTQARVADAAWKIGLAFALGLLAEWLVRRATAGLRGRLDARAPAAGDAWSRLKRLPFAFARLVLSLLALAGFALAAYATMEATAPLEVTRVVMIVTGSAYLGARALMSLGRALFAPESPQQRLIPCSDENAAYVTRWLRRFVAVAVVGMATAEALLEFNLPWSVYDSIVRVVLLVLSLFAIIIILQKREAVAAALRAPPLPEGAAPPDSSRRLIRNLRDRAAEFWHILAILYLLALWAVWALQIADGFPRLLRASGATLLIGVAAKLTDLAARRLLARFLSVGPELAARYPGLPGRCARYLPGLQNLAGIAIAAFALLLLLEAWGANAFAFFAPGALGGRLLAAVSTVALTVLAALLVWEGVNAAIQRQLERLSRDAQAARSARVRTLLPMLRTVLGLLLLLVVIITVLTEIGVNVAPLLAGAGVLGLAIGFGSQTLVRDVITGIFLLMEDAVAVGDTVTLGGLSGTVEQLSIRSIRLRALDGSVHIIPFSAVSTVTNMTRDFAFAVLDISVGYAEDTDRVAEALREIGREMRGEAKWSKTLRDDVEVMGLERFADNAVVMRARVKTEPSMRWAVGRELNRRIKLRFAELGIENPFLYRKVMVEGADTPGVSRQAVAAGAED